MTKATFNRPDGVPVNTGEVAQEACAPGHIITHHGWPYIFSKIDQDGIAVFVEAKGQHVPLSIDPVRKAQDSI